MGEFTNIAWCDHTWNPIRGCDKVSAGCKFCYIDTTPVFRFSGLKHGDPRVKAAEATWNDPFRWNKRPWVCHRCGHHLDLRVDHSTEKGGQCYAPCTDSGVRTAFHRARVFSLSLGDWLDPKIPIDWLAHMIETIWKCQNLDFLLCTKRPELFFQQLEAAVKFARPPTVSFESYLGWVAWLNGEAPKNVWVLASAENQEMLEKRVPELMRIPAVIHGLSCEPLLGPLDLNLRYTQPNDPPGMPKPRDQVDWVIAGGESGAHARPCDCNWIGDILLQCDSAEVPCFVKQLGSVPMAKAEIDEGWPSFTESDLPKLKHKKGGEPSEWPEDLRVRQFPTVDGR